MPGPEWIWVILAFLDGPELIVVVVVLLVLFGGSQLPKLARGLGQAQKEFKKGVTEGSRNDDKDEPGKPASTDERERGTTP